jgi:2-(3-amino-3-carboxypropyl)histidine synthase
MRISDYKIDLNPILFEINNKNYKTIGLQIPEGLKNFSIKITEIIKNKTNCDVIIIADSCFGACDIGNYELKNIGVEMIVQIGHTPIPNLNDFLIPINFVNAYYSKDISMIIKKSLSYLEGRKIGIITTAQHLHSIEMVKKILIENNYMPILSEGDSRICSNGQILGCNFSAGTKIMDKVNSFLFIGSGNFHPIGLILSVNKPVIAVDPYINKINKEELIIYKDKILKQRIRIIANLKNSNIF